jgi:redox-sensitive bicupin YhaK (pirin superfamily)
MMPVTVEIHRAGDRYLTRGEGHFTRHSFSFGGHYDPDNTGFGPLVCHDDHRLGSGRGFGDHPHRDLEIVTWVLSGSLVHSDSSGHDAVVRPGSVQVLSAGAGVTHSELAGPGRPARFVQAWLTPDHPGGDPSYDLVATALPAGELTVVASGHRPAPLSLGVASATFWVARMGPGDTVTLPEDPRQHVFVAGGALVRSSLAEPLADGDAFRITDHPGLDLTAAVPTELLVWSFTG